jgi:hypothetical protein
MTTPRCQRAWEAGAIEDGRLDALGAASFERHVAQCRECAREARELFRLREVLKEREPRRLPVLEQRRHRAELLRRANECLIPRRETHRAPLAAAVAAALLISLSFVVLRWVRLREVPATVDRVPAFELRAMGEAAYRDESRGARAHVVLSGGALAVHVEHLKAGQRFVLGVPDGELEVRGTRFIVEVGAGHTERVLVTEGAVVLRVEGAPERVLAAGESFVRPSPRATGAGRGDELLADTVNAPEVSPSLALEAPRSAWRDVMAAPGRGTHAALALDQSSRGRPSEDASVQPKAPAALGSSLPSAEFASAMATFRSGAYLDADERFAGFAARFPSDARQEDALFLRTVIATRRGDAAVAVARAGEYLRRFPHGLRRAEAERIAKAGW